MPFVLHARAARTQPRGLLLVRQATQLPPDRLQGRHRRSKLQVAVSLDSPYRLQSLPRRRAALHERPQEADDVVLAHWQSAFRHLHAGGIPPDPPRKPLFVVLAHLRLVQQPAEILHAHCRRPFAKETSILSTMCNYVHYYTSVNAPATARTQPPPPGQSRICLAARSPWKPVAHGQGTLQLPTAPTLPCWPSPRSVPPCRSASEAPLRRRTWLSAGYHLVRYPPLCETDLECNLR
jgi:hypothetical protein